MKFNFKLKELPEAFSQRTITKFAWCPIRIDNTVAWMETVIIKQVYECSGAGDTTWAGWVNTKFVKETK